MGLLSTLSNIGKAAVGVVTSLAPGGVKPSTAISNFLNSGPSPINAISKVIAAV